MIEGKAVRCVGHETDQYGDMFTHVATGHQFNHLGLLADDLAVLAGPLVVQGWRLDVPLPCAEELLVACTLRRILRCCETSWCWMRADTTKSVPL